MSFFGRRDSDLELPLPPPPDVASLYENAACGLACTTHDGTFLKINDTLCQWLGREPEELLGKVKLQELLTMGGRIFHQTHWAPLLRMQGSVAEVKMVVLHSDGSSLPMVLNALRRETAQGPLHEIAMFIARDRDAYERELVASRKSLEEVLREATRLHAEAKDRALFAEQMVGIVGHDLRNPLSTIQMGASLLGKSAQNHEVILGRVNRAVDRANRMIGDLLDFTQARIGSGISVVRSNIDLNRCISDAVEELALAYPGRVIQHTHEGGREWYADSDRLVQLVGNLVSNAVSYGSQDTSIHIRTEIHGGMAKLSVANVGEPIPPGIQNSLFQPMVRGKVEASGRSVGLGLFIVSEIVKAHGGTVSVSSSREEGTKFEAVFPATKTE